MMLVDIFSASVWFTETDSPLRHIATSLSPAAAKRSRVSTCLILEFGRGRRRIRDRWLVNVVNLTTAREVGQI